MASCKINFLYIINEVFLNMIYNQNIWVVFPCKTYRIFHNGLKTFSHFYHSYEPHNLCKSILLQ